MDQTTAIEQEQKLRLEEERRREEEIQKETTEKAEELETAVKEIRLSFFQKLAKHRLILVTAAFFDLLALIPIISVVFNACFGAILWLYFGSQKKKSKAKSELVQIALPIALGSILDFFLSILPINLGAAVIRIALS